MTECAQDLSRGRKELLELSAMLRCTPEARTGLARGHGSIEHQVTAGRYVIAVRTQKPLAVPGECHGTEMHKRELLKFMPCLFVPGPNPCPLVRLWQLQLVCCVLRLSSLADIANGLWK